MLDRGYELEKSDKIAGVEEALKRLYYLLDRVAPVWESLDPIKDFML